MENDKVVDIVLKRLDVLEVKIDRNRDEAQKELGEINKKLWFFAGIWAVIGGVVSAFGKSIFNQLLG